MGNKLVTVRVLSYNSEKTILDTLNSIKNQSYKNIELIVSDDCSKDKTVDTVKKWLQENSSRFVNAQLLTVDYNTGTSANVNRCLNATHGEWTKGVAADDMLLPDCITKCVDFVSASPEIEWVVGKTKKYTDYFDEAHLQTNDKLYSSKRIAILNSNLETQKEAILNATFIEAPAVFVKTEILRQVGGYNEKYELMEDWPMFKKLLFAGHKCYFLDDFLVGYRKSDNSVFNVKKKLFNLKYKESEYAFIKDELFVFHNRKYRINKNLHIKLCRIFEKFKMNNSRWISRRLYGLAFKTIDFLFRA